MPLQTEIPILPQAKLIQREYLFYKNNVFQKNYFWETLV